MGAVGKDLESFKILVTRVNDVFLQENRLLKSARVQDYSQLMSQKKELLAQLETSLASLQQARQNKTHIDKEELRALQDKIMQMLLIDRENEQLLLKQSIGSFHTRAGTQNLQKLVKGL